MRKILPIIFVILVILGISVAWNLPKKGMPQLLITNFGECVAAGNPVMESYPRQCRAGEQSFTENIGNELDKTNLIRLEYPRPNQTITSPITIKGQARGSWFFEASFPVVLTNWDGLIIAQGIATAKGDWMTADFVPFEATLTFTVDKNSYSNKGSLILKKDNPSGLPQNDDALEIPIVIAGITGTIKPPPVACTMEAKLCPDGSAVGRTGPNCEFAQCPTPAATPSPKGLGVRGTVFLGPTCPVMRDPPDPKCADKPYATTILVYRAGSSAVIATGKSTANGTFEISLPAGTYTVTASGGTVLPRCSPVDVVVGQTGYVTANISCDTGIR